MTDSVAVVCPSAGAGVETEMAGYQEYGEGAVEVVAGAG
jgi:hypothetical protein